MPSETSRDVRSVLRRTIPGPRRDPRTDTPAAGGPPYGFRRTAPVVLAVHATATVLHYWLLILMNPSGGPPLRDRLLAWDAQLYADIATDGYPDGFSHTPEGKLTGNNLAFFPLHPLLIRTIHMLTGMEAGTAAVVAAHLALVGALWAVHELLSRLYDTRTAAIGIVLLAGAQPMSLVFFMGYSESLFLALAAGALLAAHREAWLTAGVLGLLTGLTRPAAFALAMAIACAAYLAMRRERRFVVRPALAVVLACAGTPAYLLWVGLRLGRLDAYFVIQEAGWGTSWDNGAAFLAFLRHTLATGEGFVPVSTALLLAGAVLAAALAVHRGAWPPLLVYGVLVIALTLGQSNYYHSKLRLLLPAVIFLVPLARALARARDSTVVAVLGAAVLLGCWYGAHMLAIWKYAI
jgi:hypothetical protein